MGRFAHELSGGLLQRADLEHFQVEVRPPLTTTYRGAELLINPPPSSGGTLIAFMLALLEDSGYLARAAFVMDRLMYRVGLPGKAFVPLLSAHACAIPAIMAARVIDDTHAALTAKGSTWVHK